MSKEFYRLLLALVLSVCAVMAQSTSTIQGIVADPSGAAVPNATITVRNVATGEERSFTTDESGLYAVPSLPVGRYSVTAKAAGLQTTTVNDVVLEVSRVVQEDFHLAVAAATESVEIVATAPVINTANTAVGTTVDQRTVQEIPLNGRHFVDLGLLTAGTVAPPASSYLGAPLRGQGSFAIISAGNREDATNFMINGINLNDMAQNQITFQPSINTVQEFNLDNSTYSAQYGRNSGAIVNIATRSGTNGYHGEVFDYLRNNYFDARNYFNRVGQPQSPFIRNNFGADAGGPIRHDKTFFFVSYEGNRQRQGLTLAQPVLTDGQRATALGAGNPTVMKLLPLIPQANSGSSLFLGSAAAAVNIDQGTANISHELSSSDRLNGYFAFQADARQEPTLQGNNIPDFGDTRKSHRQIMTINETHVFTPSTVNEVRLGYNRIRIDFSPNAALNPADFGINIGIATPIGLPQISFRDIGLNFGGPNGFPQGRGDYTAVVSDTLSHVHGKHSLKFGGEARRFDGNSYGLSPGTMVFNTVSDFINGNIATFTSNTSSNPSRIFALATGAFVEDSYKVSRALTLQLGLRWEWNGTPVEAEDRFVNFDPLTGSLVRKHQPYQQDYRWEPRVGFAWDVFHNGKTVVRSAYGLMADQPVANLVTGLTSNPPFATPLTFNGPGFVTFSNALTAAKAAGSLNPVAVASDFKTPYVQTWNFNIQQEITPDLGVMLGYFGNKGTDLRTALNINQYLPAGTTLRPYPALSASSIVPGTALGNITQWQSNGNSEYNALWIKATKRLSKNLQFETNYTWSKLMDETSYNTPGAVWSSNTPMQDSANLRAEHSPSDLDVRQRFTFSGIYELPFKGNRAVEGWQFSLINQVQSGNPIEIVTGSTFNGVSNTVRPNILGPVPVGIGSAANGNPQYFPALTCNVPATANCLFQVPTGFGNMGRNLLVGPGFENLDMALYKNTRITERLTAQFRADTFNVFNHPNFAQPNRIVSTASGNSFGQITATRAPVGDSGSARQIQLALKLIF
jgi:Carboxypeptidase regulatory-like domain/TonB dependent receptor